MKIYIMSYENIWYCDSILYSLLFPIYKLIINIIIINNYNNKYKI